MEGELWEQGDPSTSCLSEAVKSEGMREHVCVCVHSWPVHLEAQLGDPVT